jgi:hypothetical protein
MDIGTHFQDQRRLQELIEESRWLCGWAGISLKKVPNLIFRITEASVK